MAQIIDKTEGLMAVDIVNVVNAKSPRWQRDEFIIRWSDADEMDFAIGVENRRRSTKIFSTI